MCQIYVDDIIFSCTNQKYSDEFGYMMQEQYQMSMMGHADLPNSFWGHALLSAAYALNRVPSKKVEKTPYGIWSGKEPHMSYMKIWGC